LFLGRRFLHQRRLSGWCAVRLNDECARYSLCLQLRPATPLGFRQSACLPVCPSTRLALSARSLSLAASILHLLPRYLDPTSVSSNFAPLPPIPHPHQPPLKPATHHTMKTSLHPVLIHPTSALRTRREKKEREKGEGDERKEGKECGDHNTRVNPCNNSRCPRIPPRGTASKSLYQTVSKRRFSLKMRMNNDDDSPPTPR
jgi:hypothetical protein